MNRVYEEYQAGKIEMGEAARQEMEAFDRLPKTWRDYLKVCDLEILSTDALDVHRTFGGVLGLFHIKSYVEKSLRAFQK